VLGFALALTLGLGACSVSVEVKPPHRFNGTEQTKEATQAFNGEEIQISNQNGELQVVSDSGVSKITAALKPFAIAEEGTPQSDADAALLEVIASLTITECAGKVTVSCGQATRSHGNVSTGTTGCDLTVRIPAGQGVKLSAVSGNGKLTGGGLTAADGAQISLVSNNGSVEATVTGGAKVSSGNGDVTAALTPTKGSVLDVSTENGDIDLSLPSDFAADTVSLAGGKDGKDVVIQGFADLTPASVSRGTAGTGAKSLTAKASELGQLKITSR
jgi:hypothetical protein